MRLWKMLVPFHSVTKAYLFLCHVQQVSLLNQSSVYIHKFYRPIHFNRATFNMKLCCSRERRVRGRNEADQRWEEHSRQESAERRRDQKSRAQRKAAERDEQRRKRAEAQSLKPEEFRAERKWKKTAMRRNETRALI